MEHKKERKTIYRGIKKKGNTYLKNITIDITYQMGTGQLSFT